MQLREADVIRGTKPFTCATCGGPFKKGERPCAFVVGDDRYSHTIHHRACKPVVVRCKPKQETST